MKTKHIVYIVLSSIALVGLLAVGIPQYSVWQKRMSGMAELAEAQENKKIMIEVAKANVEAAKLDAEAELIRATGMANAMKIENGQLNPTYVEYLRVRTLKEMVLSGNVDEVVLMPNSGSSNPPVVTYPLRE